MAALGLDHTAGFAGIFFSPFGYDLIVGLNTQNLFEYEGKALGRRLLKCQDFDVVVVHAQIAAMTFEVRFAQVVIEKGVVLDFAQFNFCGMRNSGCVSASRKASCFPSSRAETKSLTWVRKLSTF